MDTQEITRQAQAMRTRICQDDNGRGAKAQVCEFLRIYAGRRALSSNRPEAADGSPGYLVTTLVSILDSFTEYLQAGLSAGESPERRAQWTSFRIYWGRATRCSKTIAIIPPLLRFLLGHPLKSL